MRTDALAHVRAWACMCTERMGMVVGARRNKQRVTDSCGHPSTHTHTHARTHEHADQQFVVLFLLRPHLL